MPGRKRNSYHCRGIISTPILPDQDALRDWLRRHYDGPVRSAESFKPVLTGLAAIGVLGRTSQEIAVLGKVVDLDRNEDGSSKMIDWDHEIQVEYINQVYAVVPRDDGLLAVINANFWHDSMPAKTLELQGSMYGQKDPATGQKTELTQSEIREI